MKSKRNSNYTFKFLKDKAGLSRRWIRNTNRDEFEAGKCMIYTADEPILDDNDFVAMPVKAGKITVKIEFMSLNKIQFNSILYDKGSALLIDGLVRHRSGENVSSKSRHAYTFHVYDSGVAKWSEKNW
jgi:hypothetical protein